MPVSDPIWNSIHKFADVNPHLLKEIGHFFEVYKDLEKKKVSVEDWQDEKHAVEVVLQCQERYKENKKEVFSIRPGI